MEAHWLLEVHTDADCDGKEALCGNVVREITTCSDCECSYAPEHFMPGRLLCKLNNGVWKPGDFCSRGVPVAETRRASDDSTD